MSLTFYSSAQSPAEDLVVYRPCVAEGGWGISAYAIPIGGFSFGLAFVGWMLTRLARAGPERVPTPLSAKPAASTGVAISDAELKRLVDEEFARS